VPTKGRSPTDGAKTLPAKGLPLSEGAARDEAGPTLGGVPKKGRSPTSGANG